MKHVITMDRNSSETAVIDGQVICPGGTSFLGAGRGGNDRLYASTYNDTQLIGDADILTNTGRGGNDHLSTEGGDGNLLFGDARGFEGSIGSDPEPGMSGNARGGNDTLIVNGGTGNIAYGDAPQMTDNAKGGNDTLIILGGDDGNILYGDAEIMDGHSEGGNDDLFGGDGNDELYGDAAEMGENTTGGNDTIDGAGGDDLINGGGGNDDMWGGAGEDEFVFHANSGNDTIHDFAIGEDEINLINYFAEALVAEYQVEQVGDDTLITLLDGDSITLLGVDAAELAASDSIVTELAPA
jgi:Ca2+-binding RTX toxin-like protein